MNEHELLLAIFVKGNDISRKSCIHNNVYLELCYYWNIFCEIIFKLQYMVASLKKTEGQVIVVFESTLGFKDSITLKSYWLTATAYGQVCFHRWLFADPVNPWSCTTGPVKSVSRINKDVYGTKLLPSWLILWTVSVSVTYWGHNTAAYVPVKGITLPSAAHLPFICVTCDITVAVKSCSKFSSVG